MAKSKAARKGARKASRKVAGKAARKVTRKAAGKAARKVTRKVAAKKKPAAKRSAPKPPAIRAGTITHTELVSADPSATRTWCEQVLGWKFGDSMPTPNGPYHMWRFPNETGGGLRANCPPEAPGAIPYCEVKDIRATFEKAIAAGATEMLAPEQLPAGMGWIALVAAPGGVAMGFWSMK